MVDCIHVVLEVLCNNDMLDLTHALPAHAYRQYLAWLATCLVLGLASGTRVRDLSAGMYMNHLLNVLVPRTPAGRQHLSQSTYSCTPQAII